LYIFVFKYSFLGAAMAVSTTKTMEMILLIAYITLISDILEKIQFKWSWDCFRRWRQFLKLGIPNLMMISEWWASEIIIFMAGALANPEEAVSTMSIYQSLNAICFMFPSGFHVSGATVVGNALGAGVPAAAHSAAILAPALTVAVSVSIAAVMMVFRPVIGLIFTSNHAVIMAVSGLIPILAVYIVVDGLQTALTGILKGMGKQRLGGPIVLFSYFVVGLPISYLLTFQPFGFGFKWGVHGLCMGTLAGTVAHMALYSGVIARTDWIKETEIIQQKNKRAAFLNEPHVKQILGEESVLEDTDEEFTVWFSPLTPSGGEAGPERCIADSKLAGVFPLATIELLKEKIYKSLGWRNEKTEYELIKHYTDSLSMNGLEEDDDDDLNELNREALA
jgi:MATE family multidrug resistance protein